MRDLAFAASIIVFSGALWYGRSVESVLWLILVFSIIWITWLLSALFFERVRISGSIQRALLVVQMALVLLVGVTAHTLSFEDADLLGPATAVILLAFVAMRRLAYRREPGIASEFTSTTPRLLLAALVLGVSGLFESLPMLLLWTAGLVLVVSAIRFDHPDEPGDRPHLVHRFGDFTLIMLGESFVKVGLVAAEEPPDDVDLFGLPLDFVLVSAIWWIYFTQVPIAGIPTGAGRRRAWVFLHFPLHMGIVTMAIGLSKLLVLHEGEGITGRLLLITIPLVVVLASLAALDLVVGAPGVRRRVTAVLCAAAVVIAVAVLNGIRSSVGLSDLDPQAQLGSTAVMTVVVVVAAILWMRRGRAASTDVDGRSAGLDG